MRIGHSWLYGLALRSCYHAWRCPGHVQLTLFLHTIFRDVLNVLGMYPGDPGAPGGDCAGIVSRVPAGSPAGLQPGDAVFGLAAGSLGSYVHASAKTVVRMPYSIR